MAKAVPPKPVVAATKQEDKRDLLSATVPPKASSPEKQDFSKEIWCGIGTIFGALFTYILAPLLVDLIKHRVGIGGHHRHFRVRKALQRQLSHG
jgi:hypothetical protein